MKQIYALYGRGPTFRQNKYYHGQLLRLSQFTPRLGIQYKVRRPTVVFIWMVDILRTRLFFEVMQNI